MNAKVEDQGAVARFLNQQRGGNKWGLDPNELDPEHLQSVLQRMEHFFGPGRYFRVTARGLDNIPDTNVLLVSNHSGGTSIPDVWGFGWAWYQHFGTERMCHALAHEMVFSLQPVGRFFAQIGILRASQRRARKVLVETRRDLLVMPGGDHDTWRPFGKRYDVNFNGRTGYARLAIETGVPIVPVANAGAHQSLIVLTDGQKIAEAMHLKDLARAGVFPVHLSFPWGLGFGPLPHVPPPGHLRYRVGEPIRPPAIRPGTRAPQELVDAVDLQVREAVQGLLDQLREDRREGRSRLRKKGLRVAQRTLEHAQAAISKRL